jgi:hypothetical protein
VNVTLRLPSWLASFHALTLVTSEGGTIWGGRGSCGKIRLKNGVPSEKKRNSCEKKKICVGVFYEVLIIVELRSVVREGPKEG